MSSQLRFRHKAAARVFGPLWKSAIGDCPACQEEHEVSFRTKQVIGSKVPVRYFCEVSGIVVRTLCRTTHRIEEADPSLIRAYSIRNPDDGSSVFGVAVVAALAVLVIVLSYFVLLGGPLTRNPEAWGQSGDFVGGWLNPILSFLALLALLRTIRLQSRELQDSRFELRLSSRALTLQATSVRNNHEETVLFAQIVRLRSLLDQAPHRKLDSLIVDVLADMPLMQKYRLDPKTCDHSELPTQDDVHAWQSRIQDRAAGSGSRSELQIANRLFDDICARCIRLESLIGEGGAASIDYHSSLSAMLADEEIAFLLCTSLGSSSSFSVRSRFDSQFLGGFVGAAD